MFCNADPEGLAVVDTVTGLINSFPGSDGIVNSMVLVLLGIDTIRESTIEPLGYDINN